MTFYSCSENQLIIKTKNKKVSKHAYSWVRGLYQKSSRAAPCYNGMFTKADWSCKHDQKNSQPNHDCEKVFGFLYGQILWLVRHYASFFFGVQHSKIILSIGVSHNTHNLWIVSNLLWYEPWLAYFTLLPFKLREFVRWIFIFSQNIVSFVLETA